MNFSHHFAEVVPVLQVAEGVVMIVEKRSDPRCESMEFRVMIESVPEDFLGLLGFECVESIADFGGDEVDGVVAIPVLEAVLSIPELVRGCRTFPEVRHGTPSLRSAAWSPEVTSARTVDAHHTRPCQGAANLRQWF